MGVHNLCLSPPIPHIDHVKPQTSNTGGDKNHATFQFRRHDHARGTRKEAVVAVSAPVGLGHFALGDGVGRMGERPIRCLLNDILHREDALVGVTRSDLSLSSRSR